MRLRCLAFAVLALVLLSGVPVLGAPWEGPATVAVEVKDRSGQPVPGAVVRLRPEASNLPGEPLRGTTGADGAVAFGGLAEGEWFVEVAHPDFMSFTAYVTLRAGKGPKTGFTAQVATASSSALMRVAFVKPRTVPAREPAAVVAATPTAPVVAAAPSVSPAAAPSAAPPAPSRAPVANAPGSTPATATPATTAPTPPAPTPIAAATPPAMAPAPPPPAVASTVPPAPATAPAAPPPPTSAPATAAATRTTPTATTAPAPATAAPTAPPAERAAQPTATPAAPRPTPPSSPAPVAAPTPPAPPTPTTPVAPPAAAPPTPVPPAAAPPAPEAAPATPEPAALATPAGAPESPVALRSADRGNCPECRAGEVAATIEAVAAVASVPCTGALTAARQTLDARAAAPAAPAARALYLGPSGSACQILALLLPPGARYLGYRYEAEDRQKTGDCQVDSDCTIGQAKWRGHPELIRQANGTLIVATFENLSGSADRVARLTAYFRR